LKICGQILRSDSIIEGDLIIISTRNVIMDPGTAIVADGSVIIGADNITGDTVLATGANSVTGDLILYDVTANANDNGVGSVFAHTTGESAGETYDFDYGNGVQTYTVTGSITLGRQDVLNDLSDGTITSANAAISGVDVWLSAAGNITSGWAVDYAAGQTDTDLIHIVATGDMTLNARDGVIGGTPNLGGSVLTPTEQALSVSVADTMTIGAGQQDIYTVSAHLVGDAEFLAEIDYVPGLIVFNSWAEGGALRSKFMTGTSIDTMNYELAGYGFMKVGGQQAAIHNAHGTHSAVWDANMEGDQPMAVPAVFSSDGTGVAGGVNGFLGSNATSNATTTKHEVIQGDTLWAISQRYLGDPLRWKEIWALTKDIKDPDLILPGQKINLKQDDIDRLNEIKADEEANMDEVKTDTPEKSAETAATI
jgi:LysM repeat protein